MPDPNLNIANASQLSLAQNHLVRHPPPVAPIEQTQAGETSIDLSHREGSNSNHPQRPHYDETTIAGPPPTFEASLLELERDIDVALKRLEARREGNFQGRAFEGRANDGTDSAHPTQNATSTDAALPNQIVPPHANEPAEIAVSNSDTL